MLSSCAHGLALLSLLLSSQTLIVSAQKDSGCIPWPTLDCKARIVPFGFGSQLNDPAFWPWHATIFWTSDKNTKYICGGTLVGPLAVLTAAHCLDKARSFTPEFIVVLGAESSKYNEASSNQNSRTYRVTHVDISPEYQGFQASFKADLAILTLDKLVNSSTSPASAACLPPRSARNAGLSEGSLGDVVGFGANIKAGLPGKIDPSPHIKHVKLPILSASQCAVKTGYEPNSMFCAGYTEDSGVEVDTCLGPGDAGDGFVVTSGDWKIYNYVYGIVSKGELRCPSPVYFISLIPYQQWIEERMQFRLDEYLNRNGICAYRPLVNYRLANGKLVRKKFRRTTLAPAPIQVY